MEKTQVKMDLWVNVYKQTNGYFFIGVPQRTKEKAISGILPPNDSYCFIKTIHITDETE